MKPDVSEQVGKASFLLGFRSSSSNDATNSRCQTRPTGGCRRISTVNRKPLVTGGRDSWKFAVCVFQLVAILSLSLVPDFLLAQAGAKPKNYKVKVWNEWTLSDGYCPIRVSVETVGKIPVLKDERYTVSFTASKWREPPFIVTKELLIPANGTGATVELYVPAVELKYGRDNRLMVELGDRDGRLETWDLIEMDADLANISENSLATLLVSTGVTSAYREFDRDFKTFNLAQGSYPATVGKKFQGLSSISHLAGGTHRMIHPDQLPYNWIGLTSVDRIFITWGDFQALCKTHPRQRENLERWVAGGGSLAVTDFGDYRQADQFWQTLFGQERQIAVEREFRDWSVPGKAISNFEHKILSEYGSLKSNGELDRAEFLEKIEEFRTEDEMPVGTRAKFPSLKEKFVFQRYLQGSVFVIADPLSQILPADLNVLNNQQILMTEGLANQFGQYFDRERFKIPGVGEPPTVLFGFLITIFLIAAGPVMLIFLSRAQKMQMIFFVVPVLSLAICVGLMLYAVLIVGSSKYGRCDTVTWLDHRTNRAVSYARAIYFSGVNPGSYEYGDEILAVRDDYQALRPFNMDFRDDKVLLSGGQIATRTPNSFMTMKSTLANERLLINEQSKEKVEFVNRLGGELVTAILRTEQGYFLVNEPVGLNETGTAFPGKLAELKKQFNAQFTAHFSEREEFTPTRRSRYGNYYYSRNYSQNLPPVQRSVNAVVQNNLEEFLTEPNTYIAILSEFPFVDNQIEDVDYKLELHIVRGKW